MTPKPESKLQDILTLAHKDFEKGLNLHAFYKLNSHYLGEDLVQETFAKTWSFLVKGGEIEKMRAFLYHILNNLIIDEYRKKKNLSLDDLLEKGYEKEGEEENLVNVLDGARAMLLIKELPKNYQKIMHMRFVDELSLEEIAEKVGKSSNSIAVTIHRGVEKLRKLCQPI